MLTQNPAPQLPAILLPDVRRDLLRTSHFALAGELIGAIVHDLRQPVTSMTVSVEVAVDLLQRQPSDVKGALAALEDAIDGGRQLGTSLRVVHNLVAHRSPVRALVAFEDALAETMRLVQTEANTRRVELDVLTAANLPALPVDSSMIRQAMLNMVLDAIENVTAAHCVHVRLALTNEGKVEFTVRHVRRDDSPIEDGWTLAVARWVSEAHGVALQIDSAPDGQVTVRTQWPVGVPARLERYLM